MFLVKNFPVGQRVLVDSSFGQPTTQGEVRKEEATRQGELPLVKEVLLVALGSRQSRPYLLVSAFLAPAPKACPVLMPHLAKRYPCSDPQVHVDQELLIYEAFPHDSQLGQGNLKVRFKKVPVARPCLGMGWIGRPGQRGLEDLTLPAASARSPTTSTSVKRSQSHPRRRRKAAVPRRGLESGVVWRASAPSRIFMAIQG